MVHTDKIIFQLVFQKPVGVLFKESSTQIEDEKTKLNSNSEEKDPGFKVGAGSVSLSSVGALAREANRNIECSFSMVISSVCFSQWS